MNRVAEFPTSRRRMVLAAAAAAVAGGLAFAVVSDGDDVETVSTPAAVAATATTELHDPLLVRFGHLDDAPIHDPLIVRYGDR